MKVYVVTENTFMDGKLFDYVVVGVYSTEREAILVSRRYIRSNEEDADECSELPTYNITDMEVQSMDSADLARQEYFLDTNPIIRSKQEKKFTESIDLFAE